MSTESQSERIWRYAMRTAPSLEDARNTPLNRVNDTSGGGDDTVTMTDLSEEFGSIPSHFNLHGLALSQSQSQSPWLANEKSGLVSGTESQKENMQLPVPSGSQSPLLSIAASNPISNSTDTKRPIISGAEALSSHVTSHVTGASPPRTNPMLPQNDSANASMPGTPGVPSLIKILEPASRATPLKLNNKAVSFFSPTAPPSPPKVSRTKTMPPRLNRYAPRDIQPSSQDSFAGPPISQDLNAFARNSRILSNTFIRTTETGAVETIYQHSGHVSSASLSEPAAAEGMSISQSEQPEAATASQIFRAAFDPNLSPRPEPVVFVKDSQSEHHSQDSSHGIHSRAASLSSVSFHLPSPDADMIATQPNTQQSQQDAQPTQQNTQPTQPIPSAQATFPSSANTNPVGPSPLPVPPHRRRELAALEAARLRVTEEVVPETPQSTSIPPNIQTSGPSPRFHEITPDAVRPRSKGAHNIERSGDSLGTEAIITRQPSNRESGMKKHILGGPPTRVISPKKPEVVLALPEAASKQTSSKYVRPGDEVIPDSQEEEKGQEPEHNPLTSDRPPHQSEFISDAQDEEPQANIAALMSSPAIPLSSLNIRERPPTPTPAAVKSHLRQGRLPEGVTHTRGRASSTKAKGKGRAEAMEVDTDVDHREEDEEDAAQDAVMDVDKEQVLTEIASPVRVYKSKRTPGRSSKGKKTLVTTSSRKTSWEDAKAAPTAALAPGPSTRSKKRMVDALPEDDGGPPMTSVLPAKRPRQTKPPTLAPPTLVVSSTRVFARRIDKGNYYLPGTVKITSSSMSQSRSSTTSTTFLVKFDDGHEEDVDVQFMRQFELLNSDNVHIRWPKRHKDCTAQVTNVERWENELVDVHQLDCGPDGDDFEVSAKFISIPEARIRQQFSERRISSRLLRGDSDFDVPFNIPAKNELLAGIGFVITLPEHPRGKESLQQLITTSGGVVYEEWSSFISLGGTAGSPGRRMWATADRVRMKRGVPDQLFCLTDEARTTPKYLIALALGVPCLSLEWVLERTLKNTPQVEWPAYVLPAGYNSTTRMPASQAFDRAWWRNSGDAQNLVSDPPIFKPFRDKSFLCFGTKEFLFAQKELGIFPKLLLAMGASYVEAATDVSNLKTSSVTFDYTVVDDGEPLLEYNSAVPVDVWWIKKCLVTGIEGPVPWPDPQ